MHVLTPHVAVALIIGRNVVVFLNPPSLLSLCAKGS